MCVIVNEGAKVYPPWKQKELRAEQQSVFTVLNRFFFLFSAYLCDLVGDVVRAIFDLWSDDGFLGGRRGGALLLVVGL